MYLGVLWLSMGDDLSWWTGIALLGMAAIIFILWPLDKIGAQHRNKFLFEKFHFDESPKSSSVAFSTLSWYSISRVRKSIFDDRWHLPDSVVPTHSHTWPRDRSQKSALRGRRRTSNFILNQGWITFSLSAKIFFQVPSNFSFSPDLSVLILGSKRSLNSSTKTVGGYY